MAHGSGGEAGKDRFSKNSTSEKASMEKPRKRNKSLTLKVVEMKHKIPESTINVNEPKKASNAE